MLAEQGARHLVWEAVLIEPVEALAALRQTVLTRNPHRCPKWHFRMDDDVVLQLQPRPAQYRDSWHLFIGTMMQGQGITKAHFATRQARADQGLTVIDFGIRDGARGQQTWQAGVLVEVNVYPGRWKVGLTSAPLATAQALALKDRLVASLGRLNQLNPKMMFQPACLLCGKALTDPVSMARWIGPECAHSHSGDVGIFKLIDGWTEKRQAAPAGARRVGE